MRMEKYLVTCSIVILFILLQTDVIMSLSRRGGSRPSGGGNRGSHHKPSRPVHQPSKPSRPVHQPSKPSRPVHQPSKPSRPVHQPSRPVHQPSRPVHQPSRPVHQPVKPVQNPVRPVQEVPVQSARQPVQPVQNPAPPQNNPVKPPQNPAYPPQNPANPAQNPAYPPHNPANPAQNPAYPPQNPGYPQHNPAYPPHNPANPAQNPAYPPQNPGYPQHNPAYPPHNPANPAQNPAYPPQNPGYPQHNPAYPPQNPGYPQHNPAYPPQNPGYPQHNPAYPPQNPGYPQHNPGYPHNPNYPQNPGYPHHSSWGQNDFKPWKPKPPKTNLKHVAGAAAAGAFGGFLLGHAMSKMHFRFNNLEEERWWYANRNRYSDQVYYPKYDRPVPQDVFVRDCWNITVREFMEPSGNETADEMETRVVTRVVHEMCVQQYRSLSGHADGGNIGRPDNDPRRPNPSQPVMTHVQEEAVTGTPVENSGAILGSPMANMHFQFNDSEEERWWNGNRHRFTDHVFHPNYSQPVAEDVFMSDCVNITMGEYMKLSGNETANQTETRVLKRLVPEMCTALYHSYSRKRERDRFGNRDNKTEEPAMTVKLEGKEMAVALSRHTAAKETEGKNSDVPNMSSRFNDVLLLTNPSLLLVVVFSTCFLIP